MALVAASGPPALARDQDKLVPANPRRLAGDGLGALRGYQSSIVCPDGELLIGMEARSGQFLDSVRPSCAAVYPDGRSGPAREPSRLALGGKGGETTYYLACPAGSAVKGLEANFVVPDGGYHVNMVRALCEPLMGGPLYFTQANNGTVQGLNVDMRLRRIVCPDGYLAMSLGIYGEGYDYFVNALTLLCEKVRPSPEDIRIRDKDSGLDGVIVGDLQRPAQDAATSPRAPTDSAQSTAVRRRLDRDRVARMTDATAGPDTGRAGAGGPGEGIVIYEDVGYAGVSLTVTSALTTLAPKGWAARVSSVRVLSGAWKLCEAVDFGGACIVLTRSNDNLVPSGWNDRTNSILPVAAPADAPLR